MIFSEDGEYLDEKFRGAEVVLRAVVDGRVDRHFRRNYSEAKHLADQGKVRRIVVEVDPAGAPVVYVVNAAKAALGGVAAHEKAVLSVPGDASEVRFVLAELFPKPKAKPIKLEEVPAVKAEEKVVGE